MCIDIIRTQTQRLLEAIESFLPFTQLMECAPQILVHFGIVGL